MGLVMRQIMEAIMSFASGEAEVWGRASGVADSPCIHTRSNDAALRWLSLFCGIVRGSFQETAPKKTTENAGSRPQRWWWKFGGRNNTTFLL